jgi:uncharacterized membrane protein
MYSLNPYRISAVDQLRGIVMILMALDHTRDLSHLTALTDDPLNLATTTPGLFFTRWITHLCAPTFVFLSGLAIYLQQKKYPDTSSLRKRLLIRGAWLILLELTIVNFGIWFNYRYNVVIFQVIGAIGFGFIIMAILFRMSSYVLTLLGLLILIASQYIPLPGLAQPTQLSYAPEHMLLVAYPPLPWLGIMLLGFGLGPIFTHRQKSAGWYAMAGLVVLAVVALLRYFTRFGDPSPYMSQDTVLKSFLSFINLQKYPPSLLFTAFMLGIAFILYGVLKKGRLPLGIQHVLEVYGSVPLFYYIVHWYLLHLIMLIAFSAQGYSIDQLNFGAFGFGRPAENPSGFELPYVHMFWILTVVLLYPFCWWYRRYKQSNPDTFWARYL